MAFAMRFYRQFNALSVPKLSQPAQSLSGSKWLLILLGGVAIVAIGQARTSSAASALASDFITEHLRTEGKRYIVTHVDVPFGAFMGGSYQVTARLVSVKPGKLAILRPTIDGNCLWADCIVSMRNFEILALE